MLKHANTLRLKHTLIFALFMFISLFITNFNCYARDSKPIEEEFGNVNRPDYVNTKNNYTKASASSSYYYTGSKTSSFWFYPKTTTTDLLELDLIQTYDTKAACKDSDLYQITKKDFDSWVKENGKAYHPTAITIKTCIQKYKTATLSSINKNAFNIAYEYNGYKTYCAYQSLINKSKEPAVVYENGKTTYTYTNLADYIVPLDIELYYNSTTKDPDIKVVSCGKELKQKENTSKYEDTLLANSNSNSSKTTTMYIYQITSATDEKGKPLSANDLSILRKDNGFTKSYSDLNGKPYNPAKSGAPGTFKTYSNCIYSYDKNYMPNIVVRKSGTYTVTCTAIYTTQKTTHHRHYRYHDIYNNNNIISTFCTRNDRLINTTEYTVDAKKTVRTFKRPGCGEVDCNFTVEYYYSKDGGKNYSLQKDPIKKTVKVKDIGSSYTFNAKNYSTLSGAKSASYNGYYVFKSSSITGIGSANAKKVSGNNFAFNITGGNFTIKIYYVNPSINIHYYYNGKINTSKNKTINTIDPNATVKASNLNTDNNIKYTHKTTTATGMKAVNGSSFEFKLDKSATTHTINVYYHKTYTLKEYLISADGKTTTLVNSQVKDGPYSDSVTVSTNKTSLNGKACTFDHTSSTGCTPKSTAATNKVFTLKNTGAVINVYYKEKPSTPMNYTINYTYKNSDGSVVGKTSSSGTIKPGASAVVNVPQNNSYNGTKYLFKSSTGTNATKTSNFKYTINKDKAVIDIVYILNWKYTINYYYDGTLAKSNSPKMPEVGYLTASDVSAKKAVTITHHTTYNGKKYSLDTIDYSNCTKSATNQFVVTSDLAVVNVYYKANWHYDVEYYYSDGKTTVKDETQYRTEISPKSKTVTIANKPIFNGITYELSESKATSSAAVKVSDFKYTINANNAKIRITYKVDPSTLVNYNVKYYYNDIEKPEYAYTAKAQTGQTVTVNDHCDHGYILDTTKTSSLKFKITKDGYVCKVYYIANDPDFSVHLKE